MLKLFGMIIALLGILLFRNARYAARQYLSDRNRVVLTVYLLLLIILSYLVLTLTTRLIDTIQTLKEIELSDTPNQPLRSTLKIPGE